MTISEMLLLVAIMYGVLMFFLSMGMISLAKHSLIAFGVMKSNQQSLRSVEK